MEDDLAGRAKEMPSRPVAAGCLLPGVPDVAGLALVLAGCRHQLQAPVLVRSQGHAGHLGHHRSPPLETAAPLREEPPMPPVSQERGDSPGPQLPPPLAPPSPLEAEAAAEAAMATVMAAMTS